MTNHSGVWWKVDSLQQCRIQEIVRVGKIDPPPNCFKSQSSKEGNAAYMIGKVFSIMNDFWRSIWLARIKLKEWTWNSTGGNVCLFFFFFLFLSEYCVKEQPKNYHKLIGKVICCLHQILQCSLGLNILVFAKLS